MGKFNVEGSVILVTGANRGIGRAFVEVALELGAKKIYAGSRDISKVEDLVAKAPDKVVALKLDVTKSDDIDAVAKEAGDVQLLLNNAGYAAYSGFTVNHNAESADNEMGVNYYGMLHMSIAFDSILKKNQGAIANVVSVGGLQNFPFAATYCASKAAAHSLTQGLRAELAEEGVYVAGIYPGPVDTDMAAGVDMEKETPEQVAKNVYQGLSGGQESIFPDAFAIDFAQQLGIKV